MGLGSAVAGFSAQGRKSQNGLIRSYALVMVAGTVLILSVLLLVRL